MTMTQEVTASAATSPGNQTTRQSQWPQVARTWSITAIFPDFCPHSCNLGSTRKSQYTPSTTRGMQLPLKPSAASADSSFQLWNLHSHPLSSFSLLFRLLSLYPGHVRVEDLLLQQALSRQPLLFSLGWSMFMSHNHQKHKSVTWVYVSQFFV